MYKFVLALALSSLLLISAPAEDDDENGQKAVRVTGEKTGIGRDTSETLEKQRWHRSGARAADCTISSTMRASSCSDRSSKSMRPTCSSR